MAEILSVRVGEICEAALGIRTLQLIPETCGALPSFEAGSHIDLHLGNGLIRQYSLCGNPHELPSHYLIAVKKEPHSRGGSAAVHGLRTDQKVGISLPRNNFRLAEASARHLLVAGGIGVTPMIAMAHTLHHIDRAFELHYFTRSADHTAFRDLLQQGPFADKVRFYHGVEGDQLTKRLQRVLQRPGREDHLYLCGPQPFMDAVRASASPDWPVAAIHIEYFTPLAKAASVDPQFSVKLASDGRVFIIPANKTIAQVLEENGKSVELSCGEGICGTCITTVLDGLPDHRDQVLTDEEKRSGRLMTICCSRALSPQLVLDL
jgi:vanillate O-demethylase ferredoxin subunit